MEFAIGCHTAFNAHIFINIIEKLNANVQVSRRILIKVDIEKSDERFKINPNGERKSLFF